MLHHVPAWRNAVCQRCRRKAHVLPDQSPTVHCQVRPLRHAMTDCVPKRVSSPGLPLPVHCLHH